MQSVFVQLDFSVDLDTGAGEAHRCFATSRREWVPIPVALYRRHAWQGLFRRRLVKVRGFGREFYVDQNWRDVFEFEAAVRGEKPSTTPWVAVERPVAKRRGCGCGGRTE